MIYSTLVRRYTLFFIAGLMIFLISQHKSVAAVSLGDGAYKPESQPFIVWHTWQDKDEAILQQIAETYQNASSVKLVSFSSETELLNTLIASEGKEGAPDIFIGPDDWRDKLLDLGLIAGYCLPGQCPACEDENPPPWCETAQGNVANPHSDFAVAGLCLPEQCAPCFSENPPSWCWAANVPFWQTPDIFQAGLMDAKYQVPVGTPLSWDFTAIAFNSTWFVEQDAPRPQSLDEILQMAEQYPEFVYVEPSLAKDPTPTPMIEFLGNILADDPSPQPSKAAILVFPASRFSLLHEEVHTLLQLPLADYQPQPNVEAIFVNAYTPQKMMALDLANFIAEPIHQTKRYQASRRLPTATTAWSNITDEHVNRFGQESWLLFGGSVILSDLDPRDFIEWPELDLDFGSDPCSEAAEALHSQLTSYVGVTQLEILRAAGDTAVFRAICMSHLHRLEMELGLGDDICSHIAREVFAQKLAELRGTQGAVAASRAAAEEALAACRG